MDNITRLVRRLALPKNQPAILALFLMSSTVLFALKAVTSRYILNPDGILYMSVARQYADGHFYPALNALVSPFISWLMAPLIWLGLDPQLAFVCINALAATLTLLVGMYIVWRRTSKNFLATLLFGAIVAPFLIFAIGYSITPDLWVVLWVTLLFLLMIKAEEWLRARTLKKDLQTGVLLGFFGAVGYFIKMFLVPFFLASICVWFLARTWAHRRAIKQKLTLEGFNYFLRVPLITLLAMAAISAPWVIFLSAKYDRFMPGLFITKSQTMALTDSNNSSSGSAPVARPVSAPSPRLVPLPSAYATTYVEGTGYSYQVTGSGGRQLSLTQYIKQQLRALPVNLGRMFSVWIFIVPIFLLWTLALLFRKVTYKRDQALFLGGLLGVIYFGGYAAILESRFASLQRYFWPILILAALLLSLVIPALYKKYRQRDLARIIILVLLVCLPASSLFKYKSHIPVQLRAPAKPTLQLIAENLQKEGIISEGDKLASNNRRQTDSIAFYTGAQSLGSIAPEGSDRPEFASPSVQAALRKYGATHYLHYSNSSKNRLKLGDRGAKISKQIDVERLACENYRAAPRTACTISVVELRR